jgi:hypothetical protein
VKPYQPAGIWESTTSGRGELARFVQDHGDKLYRRGMYTFIKRTAPPPSMLIFDASNRDQCEVTRQRTSTPLQALVLLNDPQVLEAARVLAQRLLRDGADDNSRLGEAFRRILCRKASEKEMAVLTDYHRRELGRFRADRRKAAAYVNVGEFPVEGRPDVAEHAALMQVIHMLYNLEEASVKS